MVGLFCLLLLNLAIYSSCQICNSTCLTCSGTLSTDCLSCNSGYFLSGSTCIDTCPYKTMPSTRTCLTACPQYYFENTLNGFCESCQEGCITCDESGYCYDWGTIDNSNKILDLLTLWVVLAILVLILIAVILWKLCCSGKSFNDKMEEEVIDHNARKERERRNLNLSSEQMEARWV